MTLPSSRRSLVPALLTLALSMTLAASVTAHEPAAVHEPAAAPAFEAGTRNAEAPDEVMLFGRLAGAWDVEQRIIQRDGSWPEEGTSALWTFQWIHDGRAIRDEWISPAPSDPPGEAGREHGTGLRVYNPEKGRWEMAWISTAHPFVSTFEARPHGDGGIEMLGTHPSGRYSRTTFFDVAADSFSWKLELQGLGEDPEGWTEVARIRAIRRE
jgi:hypothetical protein